MTYRHRAYLACHCHYLAELLPMDLGSSVSLILCHLFLVLFGLLIFLHANSCLTATDTLTRGHALTMDNKLVSSNGKFALGFFQTGKRSPNNTLNLYFGIWFDKVPKLTPVWTANGDNPISGPAALPQFIISSDGNLVILAQGTVIWSTRANITENGIVAVILGNGNLVLRSSSNSSDIFWQSFDYPTDTLLSGAKIGWNKLTGMNRHLVSRKSLIDQASGMYSSEMCLDGIGRLSWNSSVVYWSTGKWNGKFFSSLPEMSGSSFTNFTFVNNRQEVYFTYHLLDENRIMHSLLDVSGQRKTRLWTGEDWLTIAYNPKEPCDVYAVCGPYTICHAYTHELCDCMKGFSVRSPEDWELEDRRGGCIRNIPLNCDANSKTKTGTTDKFYSISPIRLPPNGNGIPNATSANQCLEACLSRCSCTAYLYGRGGCIVWHDELLNAVSDDNGEILQLRLAAAELQSWKSNKSGMIIGVAIGAGSTALGLIFLMVMVCKRKDKWSSETSDVNHVGIISFRYVDLRRATKNFTDKLGGGSFGSVFKGFLSDSIAIAVKRLDGASQGEKEFRAEVNSVGIIQHINLVKLIGFCCECDRRLLVYEHMPNRSLDAHLFQRHTSVLGWSIRYQIALGVARGLAYLHHGCRDCIIHCDIKPENILLDANFVPKVADFGMAKFLGRDFSRVVTTTRGTIGYLAPEWIGGTAITSKVDVYSYGMVLLEIVSGKRNSAPEPSNSVPESSVVHACYFPVQVAHKLLHGEIASLLDTNLHGDANLDEAERVCKVACWCIQEDEFNRPTMVEVVRFLEGISEPEMPPMPRLLHAILGSSSST